MPKLPLLFASLVALVASAGSDPCASCSSDVCGWQQCPDGAYVCTKGSAESGCADDASLWPSSPDCDECCDTSTCADDDGDDDAAPTDDDGDDDAAPTDDDGDDDDEPPVPTDDDDGSLPVVDDAEAEQNPPSWPASVTVFGPDDAGIADVVNAAFATNGGHEPANHGEFSTARYAFLFKPGSYSVDVPVGFYTQVLGLGASPDDVTFTGAKGVYCEEGSYDFTIGALDNFWRGAENFRSLATQAWWDGAAGMLWAVSQASPLRRVHVVHDLYLWQYTSGDAAGYASGSFLANSELDGTLSFGSQQQFYTRNVKLKGDVPDAAWNIVMAGVEGAPAAHCGRDDAGGQPFVTVPRAAAVAEKPFVTIDGTGRYYLNRPLPKANTTGADWSRGDKIPFEDVYVADNTTDTASTINAKLAAGRHVVLAPGIFDLDAPLALTTPGQVLLGLGLATLRAVNGTAAITVGDVAGVRVAGVLIEAGPHPSDALLVWGTAAARARGGPSASDPGVLSDVFVRVGGPYAYATQARIMAHIRASHVIGDNVWLWRADHTAGGAAVSGGANPCETALVVDGDDVTMHGLAAEHTLRDLVVWNGERGATYMFQAEFAYDVTQDYGEAGYAGYRVADNVTAHAGFGVGVYHYFRDAAVTVAAGIVAPEALVPSFVSPLAVFLDGLGTMRHVINEHGDATTIEQQGQPSWVCDEAPDRALTRK